MPKECAVCKQPAVVAARITRGEQIANVYLFENCLKKVGKQAKVVILGSASPTFPKGTVITPPLQDTNPSISNTVSQPPLSQSSNLTKVKSTSSISTSTISEKSTLGPKL